MPCTDDYPICNYIPYYREEPTSLNLSDNLFGIDRTVERRWLNISPRWYNSPAAFERDQDDRLWKDFFKLWADLGNAHERRVLCLN